MKLPYPHLGHLKNAAGLLLLPSLSFVLCVFVIFLGLKLHLEDSEMPFFGAFGVADGSWKHK